jgi:hypothetical protein
VTSRRTALSAAALGCVLFVAACAAPSIGLFRGHLGTSVFRSYGDRTLAGRVPYRDFSLEYPPGALPAVVVPSLGPRRDYDTWFMGFEAACGLACVLLVGVVTRSRIAAAYCALAPLALGPLALHRFDLWAAALATTGTAALVAGRPRAGFAALAAGAAAKVYPVTLLPLALVHVGRRDRGRGLAWFVGVLLAVVGPFVVLAPGGVRFSLSRQLGRALQLETLGSSLLLALHAAGGYAPRVEFGNGAWNLVGGVPDAAAAVSTALQLTSVLAIWVLYARRARTRETFLLAAAAAVAAWIAFGKVLSPQFLLWLLPLVALVRRGRHAVLLLAALGLTQAVYPARYDALVELRTLPILLLVARNVLLLALVAALALDLAQHRVPQEIGGQGERAEAGDSVALDGGERDGPDGVPGLEPRRRE